METPGTGSGLRERLERCGDARLTRGWHEGEIDYVAELGLTGIGCAAAHPRGPGLGRTRGVARG